MPDGNAPIPTTPVGEVATPGSGAALRLEAVHTGSLPFRSLSQQAPEAERGRKVGHARAARKSGARIGVMHLIGSLDAGGAEGVAVAMTNELVDSNFSPHLCTTRRDGPLSGRVRPEVGRLALSRRRRIDVPALRRLKAYLQEHHVRILHAHSTSLLTAALASLDTPYPHIIWHVHAGALIAQRGALAYRLLARRVEHVIAVNEPLTAWARERLGVAADRAHYIPNFVTLSEKKRPPELPGEEGFRIVCVANLREQKDHVTLIRAMAQVVQREPRAHLLLVGSLVKVEQVRCIRKAIRLHNLGAHVTLLGVRDDVAAVLQGCDVGVLSSVSEGLPLALLEYGAAGLSAVATRVGQCADVLDEGRAGVLVEPKSPDRLAEALLMLLNSPETQVELGARLRQRVREHYSPKAVMRRIEQLYYDVLRRGSVAT